MAVIGSVSVRVVPSFKGINKASKAAFESAGVAAGASMAKPVRTSLREAVRTAITADSRRTLDAVESATRGVTDAEQGLTKARQGSESAQAKVLLAEEKLDDLRKSGKASSGQLKDAEANLAKAQSGLASQTSKVADAQVDLKAAKDKSTQASIDHRNALRKENTWIGRMSSSLPVVGDHLKDVGSRIRDMGGRMRDVGGRMTRSITMPAGLAAGAVAGIPAAFGFQRLVAIDSARAKLEGLGYSAKEVESISSQVEDAIVGTMITMDEATNIAAGALGAGVDEGQDLKDYIRLVGDAAATANVPVNDMAQIFNRVQGQGQVMLGELNMIEDAVPGTTAKLAESYNVGQAEFREMVSAGEVDSKRFMKVMDEFIGGSGEAVAGSFMGMVKNVQAYLGILGESLVGGVFQRAKKELAGFIEFLKTDEAQQWAKNLGKSIGDAFNSIVDWVKRAIGWWQGLSSSTQGFILKLVGIAAVAGPIIWVMGVLAGAIGSIVTLGGMIAGVFGRIMALPFVQHISRLVARFGGLRVAMALIGRVIGVLTGPIGWIITALVTMWTSSEKFREAVGRLGRALWDSLVKIWDALKPAFDGMGQGMSWLGDLISWVGRVLGDALAWTINNLVIPAINWLADAIVWVIDWMTGLGDTSTAQGGFIASAWSWIKAAASVVVNWFMTTALPWMKRVWSGISTAALWMWNNVLRPTFSFLADAWDATMRGINWAWLNILKPAWNALVAVARWLWNNILKPVFNFIGKAWSALVTGIRWYWKNILSPVITLVGDIFKWLWHNVAKPVFGWISDKWDTMVDLLVFAWKIYLQPMIARFGRRVKALWRDYINPALGWISDKWGWLSGKLTDAWENRVRPMLVKFGNFIREDVVPKVERGVDMIKDAWDTVKKAFSTPIKWVIDTVWNNGIASAFDAVAKAVDSDERMGRIDTSGWPTFATGGAVRGPGTGTSDDILAKLSNGEHVLTAKEVKALGGHEKVVELRKRVASGEDITQSDSKQLAGARASDAMLPMGGLGNPFKAIGEGVSKAWETGKDLLGKAGEWVVGSLKSVAKKALDPLVDLAADKLGGNPLGKLGTDMIKWGIDEVLGFSGKEDKKAAASGAPGSGAGLFDGPTGSWMRPSVGPATSWYGPRWGSFHSGVDIAGGGPTYAAYNGAVQKVGWNVLPGRTGLGILLSHGGGLQSYYGHNPVGGPQVSQGQKVKAGQHIGFQGATGNVTGTHLHWEMLRNGQAQNVNSMFRDKGGLLYPGMNMVENATGRNEFIFNQQQFDNLNKMAERGGNGRGDTYIQNVNNNGSPYQDGHDFKMHVRKASRKAGV